MKTGVSTVPCARCRRPRRAAPSVREQVELHAALIGASLRAAWRRRS
ncbi:MAG: hypothetical protein MZW92_35360 [Comamonadaceae bacterium]|nr:hypothetical protein [Comamonadaceae bacterium]